MIAPGSKKKTSGIESQFPGRLHNLMDYIEAHGLEDVMSWVLSGRGIQVHNPARLAEILPLFFSQTKYLSFRRQLNMWHFERIEKGPSKGAFMHPYFVRGNRELSNQMSRQIFLKPKRDSSSPCRSNTSCPRKEGLDIDSNLAKESFAIQRRKAEANDMDLMTWINLDMLEPTPIYTDELRTNSAKLQLGSLTINGRSGARNYINNNQSQQVMGTCIPKNANNDSNGSVFAMGATAVGETGRTAPNLIRLSSGERTTQPNLLMIMDAPLMFKEPRTVSDCECQLLDPLDMNFQDFDIDLADFAAPAPMLCSATVPPHS